MVQCAGVASLFDVVRPGAHERLCGDTLSHPCVPRMWFLIGFHCLDVIPRPRVFVASYC